MAFYDLDVQEQRLVWDTVAEIQSRISAALKVEGFDVGFEDGTEENQVHAHIHVVPRSPGDEVALPPGIDWVKP